MAKNYYTILGVNSDATADQIKSAYRRKAQQLHPDHYEGSCQPFLDVQEAYEVLSDPARRRAHDDELTAGRRTPITAGRMGGEPLRSRRSSVEPLFSTEGAVRFRETALGWSPWASPFEEVLHRLWYDWDDLAWPEAEPVEGIHVEVPLTLQQALRGGRARVWLPLRVRCSTCRGRGGIGFYACPHCHGRGAVAEERPVSISFPAGVTDGEVARIPLDRAGLPGVTLNVCFRVEEW